MENQPQAVIPDNDNDLVVVDQYDAEALKKNLETTLAQKKHWREKAKKEADEKAALIKENESLKKAQTQLTSEQPQDQSKGLDFDSIADSLNVLRELNSEEFTELRNEARNLGIDPAKYLKSKAGQSHLKEYRQEMKSKQAAPAPSGRIPVYNGKPVNDILKDAKASPAEKQAAFEARVKQRGANSAQ